MKSGNPQPNYYARTPRPHAEGLDENLPKGGRQIRIDNIVLIKSVTIAGARAQKWIATDPRNERAYGHIWPNIGQIPHVHNEWKILLTEHLNIHRDLARWIQKALYAVYVEKSKVQIGHLFG